VHAADSDEFSKVFSFKTQPTMATLDANLPELHLIYGDMGASPIFPQPLPTHCNTVAIDAVLPRRPCVRGLITGVWCLCVGVALVSVDDRSDALHENVEFWCV
jgi:hypothetical protein